MAQAGSNTIDAHVGRHLRKAREDARLSTPELADRMNLTPFELAMVEEGRRRLRTCELVTAASLLGVGIGSFYGSIGTLAVGGVPPSRHDHTPQP